MFESLSATDAVAGIRAGIDVLLGLEHAGLQQQELLDLIRDLETETRRLPAVDHVLVAQVEERGVAGELACANTATVLHELPEDCDREFGRDIEQCLVQHAPGLDPNQLARAGQRLLARLDPDGAEPKDDEHQRRRGFSLRKHPDGGSEVSGHLTPQLTAALDALFDSLAAPIAAADQTPDPRTPSQRRHDALLDACMRLIGSGTLPDCNGGPPANEGVAGGGGTPVTITATLSAEDLKTRTGYADTAHCNLIPIAALLDLAAEAEIIPVVLDDCGGILAYGRTRRAASPAQRRALAARDHGCSFPGCTRPPAWCQAHHITAWIDGGPTDLDNLTLVCGHHHREFARRGWTCHIINGVPHWVPPRWRDPDQRPIRNTAHHVDITFDPTTAHARSADANS